MKPPPYNGYIFDLDGTIYRGDRAIPGAAETIAGLRRHGRGVVFISNKPIDRVAEYAEKLRRMGIPVSQREILNSSVVMAGYLARVAPGAGVYLIGEAPLREELERAGIRIEADPLRVRYVVVSWDRAFSYHKINDALQAVRNGARLVATHADATCPVEGGEVADAGAMIGAIEGTTRRRVEVIAGKPSDLMIEAALEILGLPGRECLMVGDRLETDMRMAGAVGMAGALVLTGVTRREELAAAPVVPDYVLESVAELNPDA